MNLCGTGLFLMSNWEKQKDGDFTCVLLETAYFMNGQGIKFH